MNSSPPNLRHMKQSAINRAFMAHSSKPITKSDTDTFAPAVIRVGTGGTVVFKDAHGQTSTWANVPNGTTLDVLVTAVLSTDTTASDFHLLT